jgi:hypothetical protein
VSSLTARRKPFDAKTKRHIFRFGEFEAPLTDADVAQLHDALRRLHAFPDPVAQNLCQKLRQALEEAEGASSIELDVEAARKVQMAVYSDQQSRKLVAPTLAEARVQAFRYLQAEGKIPAQE